MLSAIMFIKAAFLQRSFIVPGIDNNEYLRKAVLCDSIRRLLGLSVAILTIITYYEKRFIVISEVSLETNPIRTFHSLVLYAGICLSSVLTIAAILSVVATWRDLESAMAVGFLCFTVVFCASVQAACWAIRNSTEDMVHYVMRVNADDPFPLQLTTVYISPLDQLESWLLGGTAQNIGLSNDNIYILVEDAMMDMYDFVYEDVRSNSSSNRRQELLTIHKTFLCCGKTLLFEEASDIENETCQSETMGTIKEDCLQAIHNFLKKHMRFVSILMIITTIIMVYGMILTSFLCFSIHFNHSLDRKDKYVLTGRQKIVF